MTRSSLRRMHVIAGVLLASVLGADALASSATRPEGFVRACGSIDVGQRHLRVDVAEGDGRLVTCAQARRIGRAFVRDHDAHLRVVGRKWSCYKARKGGIGWDNHCLTNAEHYVDVGIGRRW